MLALPPAPKGTLLISRSAWAGKRALALIGQKPDALVLRRPALGGRLAAIQTHNVRGRSNAVYLAPSADWTLALSALLHRGDAKGRPLGLSLELGCLPSVLAFSPQAAGPLAFRASLRLRRSEG